MATNPFGFGPLGLPNQVDEAPEAKKARIDGVSIKTQIPANVLLALEEQGADPDTAATAISAALKAGKRLEDVIGADVMGRAYDIADQLYPKPAAPEPEKSSPGIISDVRKQMGGALVRGVGGMADAVGGIADVYSNGGIKIDQEESLVGKGARAVGAEIKEYGDAMQAGVSEESRAAIAASSPNGDITDPSTWTMGESPSLRGYTMLASEVFGSLLPVVATAAITKSPGAAAAVGGLQGGGGGAVTARDTILQMEANRLGDGRTQLEAESAYFRELMAAGIPRDEAVRRTTLAAEHTALLMTAPVSAFGGAATGKIVSPGIGMLAGKGLATRAAGTAAASALEEGAQEAMESVATRAGINAGAGTDMSVTEGTFGDFILGAVGGGPVGAVSGALNKETRDDGSVAGSAGLPEVIPPGTGQGGPVTTMPTPEGGGVGAGQQPTPPTGPLSDIMAVAPDLTPLPEPVEATPRFPDQKAGKEVRLVDPETGAIHDAVVLGETPEGIAVRIGGGEILIDAATFDQARIAAVEADASTTSKSGRAKKGKTVQPSERPASPAVEGVDDAAAEALREQGFYDLPEENTLAGQAKAAVAPKRAPDAPVDLTPDEALKRAGIIEDTAKRGGWTPRLKKKHAEFMAIAGEVSNAPGAGSSDDVGAGQTDAPQERAGNKGGRQGDAALAAVGGSAPATGGDAGGQPGVVPDGGAADTADAVAGPKATPITTPPEARVQPDMLGGRDTNEAEMAKKERSRKEWGRFLAIAEAGKSSDDGTLDGREALIRGNRIIIRAKAGTADPLDFRINTSGMDRGQIAQEVRFALDDLNRRAPLAEAPTTTSAAPVQPPAASPPPQAAGVPEPEPTEVDSVILKDGGKGRLARINVSKHADGWRASYDYEIQGLAGGGGQVNGVFPTKEAAIAAGKAPVARLIADIAAGKAGSGTETHIAKAKRIQKWAGVDDAPEAPKKAQGKSDRPSGAAPTEKPAVDQVKAKDAVRDAYRAAQAAGDEAGAKKFGIDFRTAVSAAFADEAATYVAAKAKPATGLLSALSADKQARAEELKAKLAAKARNQVSSGLDPEYITLGGELVKLYLEAGVKKFGQMLRDFADTTGLSLKQAQEPMRAAYNHVRDNMDLEGDDITGMDDAAAVLEEARAAIKGDTPPPPAPTDPSPTSDVGTDEPSDAEVARRRRVADHEAWTKRREHAEANLVVNRILPGRQARGVPMASIEVGPDLDGGFMVASGFALGGLGGSSPMTGGFDTAKAAEASAEASIRAAVKKVIEKGTANGQYSDRDISEAKKISAWLGDEGPSDDAAPTRAEVTAAAKETNPNQTLAQAEAESTADQIDAAAAEADPNPTEAQKEAGNYAMGHIQWNGLDITIETAKGEYRRGKDADGNEWEVKLPAHYGYIRKTEGADGDHIDIYMGANPDSDVVVIVDQVDAETRVFDEHKTMLGFTNRKTALDFYVQGFSDGRGAERLGAHKVLTVAEFKEWLATGDTSKPVRLGSTDDAPPADPPAARADKIEDFGAKLEGARKEVWASYGERIKDAEKLDIKAEPLSKSWPQPDYEAMISEGVDPWVVAFIRVARESIPAKPQKAWRLKGWAEQVETLRGLAAKVSDGDVSVPEMQERMKSGGGAFVKLSDAIDLYLAVGHSKNLKGIRIGAATYSMRNGVRLDPPETVWEVMQAAKATAFSNMPRVLASGTDRSAAIEAFKSHFDSVEIAQQKAVKTAKFIIYSRDKRESWVVGVKIGRNYIDIKTVATSQEARRLIAEESDVLQQQFDKMREIPRERRDENSPRVGQDHRDGANVTPEQFSDTFGFRGVQFGNWVEGDKRQADLNQTYDSLLDLAGILDLPPKAISLNGTLGLAFGARGSGGKNAAAAHYEPDQVVINLTKKQGAGSLAHEWFHAMDNYFGRQRSAGGGKYITDATNIGWRPSDGVRAEITEAFQAVRKAIAKTGMKERTQRLDQMRSAPYWSTGIEMHARAFESYVIAKLQDQGASNDYLANIVNGVIWSMKADMAGLGDSYPYLRDDEIDTVRLAFDRLFEVIETRETDSGVSMEMRGPSDTEDTFAAEVMAELAVVDDLFQNPRSEASDLETVFEEIDPSITFKGRLPEDDPRRDEKSGDPEDVLMFNTNKGRDFYVMQTKDEVWIDVSELGTGDGGSAIYAGVGDYAFNTKRRFIGDPDGLSFIALRRRTDAMLSSALKHGGTSHLEPHPDQLEGKPDHGIPALRWTDGDDLGNVQSLIETSVANVISLVPQAANARYDFSSRTFRDGEGQPLSDEDVGAWARSADGSGAARVGRRTVKRGILLNTLAHTASGEKPGLLERSLRQSRQLVEGDLQNTFYFRPEENDAPAGWGEVEADAPITEADLMAITKEMNAELERTRIAGKVNVKVVRELYSRVTGQPIYGRHDPGYGTKPSTVSIAARRPDADGVSPVGVMRHEIIHALRSETLWNRKGGLFTPAEWSELTTAARAEQSIVSSVKERYPHLDKPGQVEEQIAELYRLWMDNRDTYAAVERAMLKIEGFLTALANLLRGKGFVSAARVMEQIATGRIGGRGPQGPGGGRRTLETSKEPDAPNLSDRVRDALGMEMAGGALPGAVRSKFKGLLGSAHWKNPGDFASNALTDAMGGKNGYNALALVPGRALFSELGKRLNNAKVYLRLKEEMDSLRNDWHSKADDAAQEWRKARAADPRANDDLMDMMHRSTLSGVDPSRPDTWRHAMGAAANDQISRYGDNAPKWAFDVIGQVANHERAYATLQERFAALPKAMQDIYRKVRANYDRLGDDFEKAVLENIETSMKVATKRAERAYRKEMSRIKDEGLEGEEKAAAEAEAKETLDAVKKRGGWGAKAKISALRKKFESNKLKGPYFPLARFGNFFVTVRNHKGEVVSFSRFEKESQQQAFIREKKADGVSIQFGVMSDAAKLKSQVDPTFVADIEGMLADAGASDAVMDAIWQRWLETLPDQSIRTAKIHRKGREGWNADAFRAFGNHMFHGAHQLARLKYGLPLEEALNDAEDEARVSEDPNRAGLIVNEMRRRHEFTMNPAGSSVVASLSSLSFIWYLGATPAAALANISQTTVMGPGIMAARFKGAGVTGALREIGAAAKDFAMGKGDAQKSPRITQDEHAALSEAYRRGTIDKTQAHDLASVAETGIEYNSTREAWMRKIGFMFHHAERMNREVTFLANYRLARADGLRGEEAIDAAADLTWKIHFDYQNTSRPRFMQSDLGKVLTIFRSFTVNNLWRMFRDSHQMLRGATPEERAEARTQLVGITLSMMAHAGIRGTWGYGLLMGMLAVFFPGDEDDIEEWMQDAMLMEGDNIGVSAWNFAMGAALNGVPGQIIGADLTERIGSPNLWFRGPSRDLEGEDVILNYVTELLGPPLGIALGIGRGIQMVADGEVWRGAEAMLPKVIRDVMKTGRYATEGVETMNGDDLLENVNPWQLLLQANGFTPAAVAERYDINSRLKNKEREVMDERKGLHKAATEALRAGEPIPASVMDEIRDFNRRWPEYPITGETIKQSLQGRLRASSRNEGGVQINPKINDRLREELAPSIN